MWDWQEESKYTYGKRFYNRLLEEGMDFSLRTKAYKEEVNEGGKRRLRTYWKAELKVWITDKKRYQEEYGREYMDMMGYESGGTGEGRKKVEARMAAWRKYSATRWF